MNISVNISRSLLGPACIGTGLWVPATFLLLAMTSPQTFPDLLVGEGFTHITRLALIAVTAVTTAANAAAAAGALRGGATALELLPRNAATMLTGSVGMMLVYIYLMEAADVSTGTPHALLLITYALNSATLLMEGLCLLANRNPGGRPAAE